MTAYDTALDVNSPVSHWKLGEPSGTTITDRIGTQNGLYNSSPTLAATGLLPANTTQNASDTAVSFVPNQVGAVGENAAHRPASLTVEFWVKIPSSAPADFKGVFFKSSGDSWNDGYGFTWRNQAGPTYSIEWWCNVYTNAVVIPVTLDETLYVAGTFTGGTLRAYKNGSEVGTPVTGVTLTHSTNQMLFAAGSTIGGSAGYYFTCTMDEIAIYSTALSGAAIAAHYAAGGSAPAVAPTLYVTHSNLRFQ